MFKISGSRLYVRNYFYGAEIKCENCLYFSFSTIYPMRFHFWCNIGMLSISSSLFERSKCVKRREKFRFNAYFCRKWKVLISSTLRFAIRGNPNQGIPFEKNAFPFSPRPLGLFSFNGGY